MWRPSGWPLMPSRLFSHLHLLVAAQAGLEFVCVFGHDGFPMSISIVGSAMRARGLAAQRVEARIGCKILNTMTALGSRVDWREAAEHGRSKRRNQRRIDFLRSTTEIKLSCDRFLGPETDATCLRA